MSLRIFRPDAPLIPIYRIQTPTFSFLLGFLNDQEVCKVKNLSKYFKDVVNFTLACNSNELSLLFCLNSSIKKFSGGLFTLPNHAYISSEAILRDKIRKLFRERIVMPDLSIMEEGKVKEAIAKIVDDNIFILWTDLELYHNLFALIGGMKGGNTPGKYELCSKILNKLIYLYDQRAIEMNVEDISVFITEILRLSNTLPVSQEREVTSLRHSLLNSFNFLIKRLSGDDEFEDVINRIYQEKESIFGLMNSFSGVTAQDHLTKLTRISCFNLLINLIKSAEDAGDQEIAETIQSRLTDFLPLIEHIGINTEDLTIEEMNLACKFLSTLNEADYIEDQHFTQICSLLKRFPDGNQPRSARANLIRVLYQMFTKTKFEHHHVIDVTEDSLTDIINSLIQIQTGKSKKILKVKLLTISFIKQIYKNCPERRASIDGEFDRFSSMFKSIEKSLRSTQKAMKKKLSLLFSEMAKSNETIKSKLEDSSCK